MDPRLSNQPYQQMVFKYFVFQFELLLFAVFVNENGIYLPFVPRWFILLYRASFAHQ